MKRKPIGMNPEKRNLYTDLIYEAKKVVGKSKRDKAPSRSDKYPGINKPKPSKIKQPSLCLRRK